MSFKIGDKVRLKPRYQNSPDTYKGIDKNIKSKTLTIRDILFIFEGDKSDNSIYLFEENGIKFALVESTLELVEGEE